MALKRENQLIGKEYRPPKRTWGSTCGRGSCRPCSRPQHRHPRAGGDPDTFRHL